MIYLDHNATSPVRPEVLEAMLPWLKDGYGNPNSVYSLGQKARAAVEKARECVAQLVGAADSSEIVFTSGGTESDVFAISGAAWLAKEQSRGRNKIVSTCIEHDAVRTLLTQLRRRGFEISEVPCAAGGIVLAEAAQSAIDQDTAVVSVMHANNETGVLQPVAEIAAYARQRGALMHTDAVQSLGKIAVDVKTLGVDLLSLSGHKLNAPKGIGALFVRRGVQLSPVLTGHQEKERRGGTENVAGIAALGAAARLALRELDANSAHSLMLRRRLESGVLSIPGAKLNGDPERRLPNTSSFTFKGVDGHHLVVALDLEGFCVSSGPACSSGSSLPSHVLTAMGIDALSAASSLRVSVGWGTTEADVDRFLKCLPAAVERLRSAAGVA